jgi:hypothetical protein
MAGDGAELPGHITGHVGFLDSSKSGDDAIVSDVGVRHDDNLPLVRRVRHDLLIPRQRRTKDDFPGRFTHGRRRLPPQTTGRFLTRGPLSWDPPERFVEEDGFLPASAHGDERHGNAHFFLKEPAIFFGGFGKVLVAVIPFTAPLNPGRSLYTGTASAWPRRDAGKSFTILPSTR